MYPLKEKNYINVSFSIIFNLTNFYPSLAEKKTEFVRVRVRVRVIDAKLQYFG